MVTPAIKPRPGATSALHVMVLPGHEISKAALSGPAVAAIDTVAGSTAHFRVSFDSSLGTNGATLANAVLATCERDFAFLQRVFGGITPGGLPFDVRIIPGSSGASHAGCAATGLNCQAFSGTNADLVRMLVVAEADELFMAAQNAGWDCGASNGEGLSRIL